MLLAQKKMSKRGSMKVIRVHEMVMEVFAAMGFADILTIEKGRSSPYRNDGTSRTEEKANLKGD